MKEAGPTHLADDRGSATLWMVGVVTATFVLIGLVIDGGAMLRVRSDAFGAAASAARAGAQELDDDAAVEGQVVLDSAAARRAAMAHLERLGYRGSVTVTGATVTVTAVGTAALQLLRIVGGDTATFEATASATATKVETP
jgi:Flp pilus assembly protein TadG